ncbi:nucleotidyltransferase family protein [Bradyrhizobium sp. MOS003]|uniref:nucleotidyltransferase domain-containing protein n=1 Tax=Bradyrhizobium sp. MOS003 TaxID=2133946 RepID=UPI000D12C194|nr:nucleotidyltransferase family protein [Bradyrhizobium sp. MOS003]PSO17044.1 hypothetical protein C7G42_19840 [Bradyrhizobium sp. MOS003]
MTLVTISPSQRAAFDLVLSCARAPNRPTTAQAVEQSARRVEDWDQVLRVVRRHRIAGLAHQALAASAAPIPDAVRETLARQAGAIARAGLMLANESIKLDAAFRAADIEVGFLKGPVLSMQLYGDIGTRHSRDLDLFVDPADLVGATRVLQRLGYHAAGGMAVDGVSDWVQRLNQWEFRHDEKGTLIELHWRLCPNAELAGPLAAALVWTDADIGGGRTIRTLRAEPLAAYLCLHGGLHAWSRLKWLADIDVLLSADPGAPQRLLALADHVGLQRPVGQAFWLASELLGMPLDAVTRDALANDRAVRRLSEVALDTIMTGGGATELEETALGTTRVRLSHFSLGRGWRHWRTQALLALASGEDLKLIRLPKHLAFVYAVLRPVFWAIRKGTAPRGGGARPAARRDERAVR